MRTLSLLAAALLCAASTAFALGPSFGFGVHGNYASINVPGQLKDIYGPGYGGGAHLDLNLVVLSARLSADYTRFSPDNDKYKNLAASVLGTGATGLSIDGGNVSIYSANANLKFDIIPTPILGPYVTGGVGIASINTSDATVTLNGAPVGKAAGMESSTKTSANIGAGVDFKFGITLFVEARYTWIFTEGETSTYVPVTLGITF